MKPTLIITDDCPFTRDRLHRALQEDFEIVEEVGSAQAAVDAVARHQPMMVLMDLVMPQMSGIDAVKKIRETEEVPPLIVMLSGVTDNKFVMESLAAGAADYLFKPFSDEILSKQLWEIAQTKLDL